MKLLIYQKNVLTKEISCILKDNNTQKNVESWSGRGNKVLVPISPTSHLKYDRFKENFKNFTFVSQSFDDYSNNAENFIFKCDKCMPLFS